MSWRVHTADVDQLAVCVMTCEDLALNVGYEFENGDEDEPRLVILDQGNQEAFVITGDSDNWRRLGVAVSQAQP